MSDLIPFDPEMEEEFQQNEAERANPTLWRWKPKGCPFWIPVGTGKPRFSGSRAWGWRKTAREVSAFIMEHYFQEDCPFEMFDLCDGKGGLTGWRVPSAAPVLTILPGGTQGQIG